MFFCPDASVDPKTLLVVFERTGLKNIAQLILLPSLHMYDAHVPLVNHCCSYATVICE